MLELSKLSGTPAQSESREASKPRQDDSPAPLILVVDDVEDARAIWAEYLEFRGYRVATAADGLEAVAKAAELLPDIILMDIYMPNLNGIEATRRIKGDRRTASIPVIAVTAHASEAVRVEALVAGCVKMVAKPVNPRQLEEEIRTIVAASN